MPRPDTGSFNRLLTSLGLILMAAALLIPYFFYRSTSTLQIGRGELAELTETARKTIEARQADVSNLQPFMLPAAALLFVLGIAILIWGGYRLHGAQGREDREAEARTIMAEAGVRDLTPGEKEVKIEEEVRAETDPPDLRRDVGEPTATPGPSRDFRAEREQRFADTRRIEKKVGAALSGSDFPHFIFRSQVAVGSLKLDGLFLATKDRFPDVLVEVRMGRPGMPPTLVVDRVLASVPRYEAERTRKALPWLITVFPEGFEESDEPNRNIDQYFRRLRKAVEPVGWTTVIREEEIGGLPSIFTVLLTRLEGRDD